MKTQRTILTIVLTIFSLFSSQLKPQGPGPLDMWDTLPPEQQLAAYVEAAKFAKGVFKGVGNEAKDIIDDPGQAAAMGVIGLGTTAFLQVATPEVAATATRVLCTLATAETVAQLHSAYVNAPENQRSEAVGERLGRMITDVFFLRETIKASSSALTSFKPSKPLSYVVKVDDYAFAAKFNPDGHHLFSVGRNFGNDGFTFSVYGLDPINGLLYYGPQSVKSIGTQLPAFAQQTIDVTSFYTKMPVERPGLMTANNPMEIIRGSGLMTDAAQFAQTAKHHQANRIITLLNQVGVKDYTDPSVVFDKVSNKIDPAIYTPLENLLKVSLEQNISELKKRNAPFWTLLECSGDPAKTSNIKGANGEINVGVLQQLMGRKLIDYNKKIDTQNLSNFNKKYVTYDWAVIDTTNQLILIEAKNQKWGSGDEEDFARQVEKELYTINSHPDLKGARFEVWSEHPLTDGMKNFLNENGVKYFEGYSSLAKLYFPEMKQPIFFDNPTPTQTQQFSLLNNFLSQAPSLKFTPPASWFTGQGYQANEPPLRSTSSPFGSWSTAFAGMPLFNEARDWTKGIKWDSYFDSIKNKPPFLLKSNDKNSGQEQFRKNLLNSQYFSWNTNFDPNAYTSSTMTAGPTATGFALSSSDSSQQATATIQIDRSGAYGAQVSAPLGDNIMQKIGKSPMMAPVLITALFALAKGLETQYTNGLEWQKGKTSLSSEQQRLAIAQFGSLIKRNYLYRMFDPKNQTFGALVNENNLRLLQAPIAPFHMPVNADIDLSSADKNFLSNYVNDGQKAALVDQYKKMPMTHLIYFERRSYVIYQYLIDEIRACINGLNGSLSQRAAIQERNKPEDAVWIQTNGRSFPDKYNLIYERAVRALEEFQNFEAIETAIVYKQILLKQEIQNHAEFLKRYNGYILKSDNSQSRLKARSNAIDESLKNIENMTFIWRMPEFVYSNRAGYRDPYEKYILIGPEKYKYPDDVPLAKIPRQVIISQPLNIELSFGLPIQHSLGDEILILYNAFTDKFVSSTDLSNILHGLARYTAQQNLEGNISCALIAVDLLYDFAENFITTNGQYSWKNEESLNHCSASLAFLCSKIIPILQSKFDVSYESFVSELKQTIQAQINDQPNSNHISFFKGLLGLINCSPNNQAFGQLMKQIYGMAIMANHAEQLGISGLELISFLITNPKEFQQKNSSIESLWSSHKKAT